eukprot:TRINITY_DN41276_c0_g1_i1.p1 TRINITY_DN41276_c0_g1~~TRINITY_DN41276_c0_g1_i1.p1  ORF type:complete len:1142 (-),score=193.21 TRINITY_DN41276_c0_g1_i1:27-3452(-)
MGDDHEVDNEKLREIEAEEQAERAIWQDDDSAKARNVFDRLQYLSVQSAEGAAKLKEVIMAEEEFAPITEDSADDMHLQIGRVLGDPAVWSAGTREANDWQQLMEESYQRALRSHLSQNGDEKCIPAPPRFVTTDTCKDLDTLGLPYITVEIRFSIKSLTPKDDSNDKKDSYCHAVSYSTRVAYDIDPNTLLEQCCAAWRRRRWRGLDRLDPLDLVFKAPGWNEYLFGTETLPQFQYARESLLAQAGEYTKSGTAPTLRLIVVAHAYRRSARDRKPLVLDYPPLPVHEDVMHSTITCCPIFARNNGSGNGLPVVPPDSADLFSLDNEYLSLWDVNQALSVTITGLYQIQISSSSLKRHQLEKGADLMVCVIAELVYAGQRIAAPLQTPWRTIKAYGAQPSGAASASVMWGFPSGRLVFEDTRVSDLPRETRLSLSLCVAKPAGAAIRDVNLLNSGPQGPAKEDPVWFMGWVNVLLFDHYGCLAQGKRDTHLWVEEKRANPISVVNCNPPKGGGATLLSLEFPTYPKRVIFPAGEPPPHKFEELLQWEEKLTQRVSKDPQFSSMVQRELGNRDTVFLKYIQDLCGVDPLYKLTDSDKALLWVFRRKITHLPRALPKFLQAVDWCKPAAVYEAHILLRGGAIDFYRNRGFQAEFTPWAELDAIDALELLDARYPDAAVRELAVRRIDTLTDSRLSEIVLQLVQVLKYESYHYSALGRFLLRRAVREPYVLGQPAFWHLKAEMSDPKVSERHGLLLQEFLRRSATRHELLRQNYIVETLLQAAYFIKEEVKEKGERKAALQKQLGTMTFPPLFTLPLDPRMQCSGVIIEKCKVMDSKKIPLWITFRNADQGEESVKVIFKAGDDLRQDLLTLQMLHIMDSLWKSKGLDLHLRPYGCIATDDGVGMIEVVDKSNTVANITREFGGARAAYSELPLLVWLQKNNPDQHGADSPTAGASSPRRKSGAALTVPLYVDNFVRSCAGYGPATYILGIGDRHNDNVMLTVRGDLFHIDFGHFLGNFKQKFGFKRETTPFVFTPMYAHVMGGTNSPQFKRFCDLACQAFVIVRDNANLLINLFALMLSTGIPELTKPSDVDWLKEVLLLRQSVFEQPKTDKEVAEAFHARIFESLNNKKAVLNDYIHILAHA